MSPKKRGECNQSFGPPTYSCLHLFPFFVVLVCLSLFVLSPCMLMRLQITVAHSYRQGLWLNRSPHKSQNAIRHRSKWILGRDNVLCKTVRDTSPMTNPILSDRRGKAAREVLKASFDGPPEQVSARLRFTKEVWRATVLCVTGHRQISDKTVWRGHG